MKKLEKRIEELERLLIIKSCIENEDKKLVTSTKFREENSCQQVSKSSRKARRKQCKVLSEGTKQVFSFSEQTSSIALVQDFPTVDVSTNKEALMQSSSAVEVSTNDKTLMQDSSSTVASADNAASVLVKPVEEDLGKVVSIVKVESRKKYNLGNTTEDSVGKSRLDSVIRVDKVVKEDKVAENDTIDDLDRILDKENEIIDNKCRALLGVIRSFLSDGIISRINCRQKYIE